MKEVQAGDTALLIAIRKENPEIVTQLLKSGASVKTGNTAGETPLQLVSKLYKETESKKQQEIAKVLVRHILDSKDSYKAFLEATALFAIYVTYEYLTVNSVMDVVLNGVGIIFVLEIDDLLELQQEVLKGICIVINICLMAMSVFCVASFKDWTHSRFTVAMFGIACAQVFSINAATVEDILDAVANVPFVVESAYLGLMKCLHSGTPQPQPPPQVTVHVV
ncbi:hypothetical protein GPECTOR_93g631 [Gonium pectorale]|uniref:Uncharacterized protein n=1 Tax=Gonium pectorale TaxID=33097 RepID=A0A150G0K7_GONPE|nr:hypothetical protein GPECTOR_93g631 [Gonium pectorale]|eukprot:KXZ43361.1 hypothetical protein GPECTOR_93g631 [Gonium pectorale]